MTFDFDNDGLGIQINDIVEQTWSLQNLYKLNETGALPLDRELLIQQHIRLPPFNTEIHLN